MNLKIIGKMQNKVILLFIKIFKLKVDKVDVQYSISKMKKITMARQELEFIMDVMANIIEEYILEIHKDLFKFLKKNFFKNFIIII